MQKSIKSIKSNKNIDVKIDDVIIESGVNYINWIKECKKKLKVKFIILFLLYIISWVFVYILCRIFMYIFMLYSIGKIYYYLVE